METKAWWKSITIWGAIIGAISYGLQLTGMAQLSFEEQQNITQQVVNTVTSIGDLISIIMIVMGRWRANKPISNKVLPIGGK